MDTSDKSLQDFFGSNLYTDSTTHLNFIGIKLSLDFAQTKPDYCISKAMKIKNYQPIVLLVRYFLTFQMTCQHKNFGARSKAAFGQSC